MDSGVAQLAYLLDESFDRNDEHSLLANLRTVSSAAWAAVPPEGGRSIRDIADHAGVAIRLYADHLFGAATLDYLSVHKTSPGRADPATIPALVDWIREGHRVLRTGLASLRDADLSRPARSHWGEPAETRWLVGVIIQHNTYHAGEINHLRSMLQGDDRWPWQSGR